MSKEQKDILSSYVQLAKKKGRHATIAEMEKAGLTRNKCRHHFGTLEDLRKAARESDPKAFQNIDDEELFSRKNFKRLEAEASKYRRFVIVTAVSGCRVHEGFLASIRTYCILNKAALLVLPSSDPASNAQAEADARRWYCAGDDLYLDPALKNDLIVFGDLGLNKKIFVSSIKLSAKHIDPITGLGRIGQRNGSFIYASPKQRLKMTPTSNNKLPHAVMTTGAITRPSYKSKRYMSDRTAYLAEHDHVMGAIIVEIRNEKRYHYRQIQADKRGAFPDLGVLYNGENATEYAPDALVLGDFHSGETDERARLCFLDAPDSVREYVRPSRLVVHDGFNGLFGNHHEFDDPILRAQRFAQAQLSLESEVRKYGEDLNRLCEQSDEVIIVKSNHDDFLYTYLKKGFYKQDPQNFALAMKVLSRIVDAGTNPIKIALEVLGVLKYPDKLRWLERDEDFKIAGIELGAHGDKGANGARGSLRAMESAYGNSVSGHAHTPEILRGAWQVGTLSKLKLNYNVGASSWMHTSCLVYPNGARQLINVIDGKWRLDEDSIELGEQPDSVPQKGTGKAK